MSNKEYVVGFDRQGSLSIKCGGQCVPIVSEPLDVYETTQESWGILYTHLPSYPIDEVCRLALAYGRSLGISEEAKTFLNTCIMRLD